MPTTKELLAKKKSVVRQQLSKKQSKGIPSSSFSLMKAIRGIQQKNDKGEGRLYKANHATRDKSARKYIEENLDQKGKAFVRPGQLVMFHYFEPKTKEDLQYYDAMPCTIFFGVVKTDQGPRVIGFNIHYYPPRMRYALMDRIFDIYKPMYLATWNDPLKKDMDYFNYKMLMDQLKKAKLDFGIREYIPQLIANIIPIPPKEWQKAVFTEGKFKKETREQILKYWKDKAIK